MTFEIYWSYYLSIEKMFSDTFQYVSPSEENSDAYSPIYASTTNESFLYVTPFENMDSNEKYAGLSWWRDNQLLKHNRMENAKRGNLENALYAIVAYYILITKLMNYVEGDSKYLKDNNNTSVLIPVA